MTRAQHIASLVGKPYRLGALGPDAFDCYGLARHVLIEVFGVPEKRLLVGSGKDWTKAMKAGKRGFKRIDVAREGCLVLAGSATIGTHVGVVVASPAQPIRIMHALEEAGGVVIDALHLFQFRGFNRVHFYAPRP